MYGCNKLYGEMLGAYYSTNYRQLAADRPVMLDFRSLRFPGLISAFTVPSGGTSDYGPEMIHAAAQGKPYTCFVREDTRIPFMAMPDAVKALLGSRRRRRATPFRAKFTTLPALASLQRNPRPGAPPPFPGTITFRARSEAPGNRR
jgi:hypothetical protein